MANPYFYKTYNWNNSSMNNFFSNSCVYIKLINWNSLFTCFFFFLFLLIFNVILDNIRSFSIPYSSNITSFCKIHHSKMFLILECCLKIWHAVNTLCSLITLEENILAQNQQKMDMFTTSNNYIKLKTVSFTNFKAYIF